jgi:transposase-like protein
MKYTNIKSYSDAQFRRVTGLKRETFNKALEILSAKYAQEHSGNVRNSGRKSTLSIEDKLLATLEYLREYRTYSHIAASYGIAESNIYRTIKWVEETLIKDGTFSLPGKKALVSSNIEYEVVYIDATETPIERPKKNSGNITPARRKSTL